MTYVTPIRKTGTKEWAHLVADSPKELQRWAERLKVPIKDGCVGTCPHLDLPPHKRELALRYGAIERE